MKYEKSKNLKTDEPTIIENTLRDFDFNWTDLYERLKIVPGINFLSALNTRLQDDYEITVTAANIINSLQKSSVQKS